MTGGEVMPSPFPGMDPYLEGPGFWNGFHLCFINYLCETIADRLPDQYEAQPNEQIYLIEPERNARPWCGRRSTLWNWISCEEDSAFRCNTRCRQGITLPSSLARTIDPIARSSAGPSGSLCLACRFHCGPLIRTYGSICRLCSARPSSAAAMRPRCLMTSPRPARSTMPTAPGSRSGYRRAAPERCGTMNADTSKGGSSCVSPLS